MKEYFSHDHNAVNDRKVIALVNKYKSSGYGIFWATNEMMHEEGGELDLDAITYDALAKRLNEDAKHIKLVINDCVEIFLLYMKIDNKLTSNRVIRNLSGIEEKKQVKVDAGRSGGLMSGLSRKMKQNEALVEAESKQRTKLSKLSKESKLNSASDFVCYDVEQYILNNQQLLEKICIATSKGLDVAKKELHAYHLWLTKKEKYPTTNIVVCAGFETWLLNGYNYKKMYNSSDSQIDANNINSLL